MASEQGQRRSQRLDDLKRKRYEQLHDGSNETGSPSDQIQRKNLTVEDIDYEYSYADRKEYLPSARKSNTQKPTNQRQWKYWGKQTPLNDPAMLPEHWTMAEHDLDEG